VSAVRNHRPRRTIGMPVRARIMRIGAKDALRCVLENKWEVRIAPNGTAELIAADGCCDWYLTRSSVQKYLELRAKARKA
jgi:hypothetical protein